MDNQVSMNVLCINALIMLDPSSLLVLFLLLLFFLLQESSQRCASEIIAGLVRSSTQWPYDMVREREGEREGKREREREEQGQGEGEGNYD